MLERLNEYRQLFAAAAAVVAVYVYGVAYFALSAYYRPLGMSPSDAGVTQSTLVAMALSGLAFLFGALVLSAVAGGVAYRRTKAAKTKKAFIRRRVLVGLGGLALFGAGVALGRAGFVAWGLAGIAVGAGLALVGCYVDDWRPHGARTRRRGLVGVAALLVAVMSWVFLLETTTASERLARKAMADGDFRNASLWERTTGLVLNVETVPVEANSNKCASLIAYSGGDAWVMESEGDTVEVRKLARTGVVVRYARPHADRSQPPQRRACWGKPSP